MPLVNGIICFLNLALLSSWWYLLLKLVVYVSKMPRWVEPIPSQKPCEPESFHESYSTVVMSDKISTQLCWRREVNERLCIREVGVDLELCVHAHGHDVDPIMEASCNNNYFLDKYHLVSVNWPFGTMDLTMIVLLWFYFSDKLKYLPSADQYACPTSILFYLRVLPPGISRISTHCTSSYEFLMK